MSIPTWYQKAIDELGVKEITGAKHEKRIVEYHSATGLAAKTDEVPWCGSFVGWVMRESGIEYDSQRAAMARSWLTWGKEIKSRTNIPIGAVLVLKRGAPPAGHVTFFGGWVDEAKTKFKALGGNQSNGVTLATYPVSQILEHGVRWPAKVPLPVAQQPLQKSPVVVGTSLAGGLGAISLAKEIVDSTQDVQTQVAAARDGFSQGDILGIAIGVVILIALGVVIWSRVNGKRNEQQLEKPVDSVDAG